MTSPLQLVGNEPTTELTVAEAATRFGVSPTTIRRRLNEKPGPDGRRRSTALPHAHQDETGVWMIPFDDLEVAQFKAGPHVDSSVGGSTSRASGQRGPSPVVTDSLRDELADARRRAAVAEAMANETRRELNERLIDKDEALRATHGIVETQSATITALTREVEGKDHLLALMKKRVEALDAGPSGGSTGAVTWEASGVATDPDETDPVPVGELRRRLAEQQPPPRHWWQRMRRT
jgi:hypothetical protein